MTRITNTKQKNGKGKWMRTMSAVLCVILFLNSTAAFAYDESSEWSETTEETVELPDSKEDDTEEEINAPSPDADTDSTASSKEADGVTEGEEESGAESEMQDGSYTPSDEVQPDSEENEVTDETESPDLVVGEEICWELLKEENPDTASFEEYLPKENEYSFSVWTVEATDGWEEGAKDIPFPEETVPDMVLFMDDEGIEECDFISSKKETLVNVPKPGIVAFVYIQTEEPDEEVAVIAGEPEEAALEEKPDDEESESEDRKRQTEEETITPYRAEFCDYQITVFASAGTFEKEVSLQLKEIEEKPEALDYIDPISEKMYLLRMSFEDEEGQMQVPQRALWVSVQRTEDTDEEDAASLKILSCAESGEIEFLNSDRMLSEISDTLAEEESTDCLFETDSTVFGIVEPVPITTITKENNSWRVSVSYNDGSCFPRGVTLSVQEIKGDSFEEYVGKTADVLNQDGFGYARVFDISILDKEGKEYQPQADVSVNIELLDSDTTSGDFSVVHFEGEEEQALELPAATDGQTVSFTTDGFSAYAIVQGPPAEELGWKKIHSIDELETIGQEGVYISAYKNFFFSNTIVETNEGRKGIKKTKPESPTPPADATLYYFERIEGTNQFYVYCYNGTEKQYVYNNNQNSLYFVPESEKMAFTVEYKGNDVFMIHNGDWYWNQQGNDAGTRFCSYNKPTDNNNRLFFRYGQDVVVDPYDLDGKTYGLMRWNGGTAGKALMDEQLTNDSMGAKILTVLSKANQSGKKLFVPNDSDIDMWTFHWIDEDHYHITTEKDGETHYLQIDSNGIRTTSNPNSASTITLTPGTGSHAGEFCLSANNATLTYSGSSSTGFSTSGSVGNEWLHLVDFSDLTSDYLMTYSARKISVSDANLQTGDKIIVYTRVWNSTKKRYDYYAVDETGGLVQCYESGDDIEWIGTRINTLLWDFTEYHNSQGERTDYYELYNEYSGKYIAPDLDMGQILSDGKIGINLDGRRKGKYYSSIITWDDEAYEFTGIKVENGRIVPCPLEESDDFYFAVIEDSFAEDDFTTVETVDNNEYGIKMRLADFTSRQDLQNFIGGGDDGFTQGLLTTNLPDDNYPISAINSNSFKTLYQNAEEVNHLFIQSTYSGTGYFEYDSTQNFASLNGRTGGDFAVYRELGTMDEGVRPSLKHGQFMPYNQIQPGVFAEGNPENMYTALLEELPNSDPRKHERLYLVKNPDYQFGMELEAEFIQTPSGKDIWGHDIIFEFSGDDDFWLYVDGELVIDLGGVRSALSGNVNFCTGDVVVNGQPTTLRQLFSENYMKRNPNATQAELDAYLLNYFAPGETVFHDYTSHTMRIFYMERGASASNLHMKFNLTSIKPGTIQLKKELANIDQTESILAEFPYQIYYKIPSYGDEPNKEELLAPNDEYGIYVNYQDTETPVKYKKSITIDGITYNDVFLLKPNEIAEIKLPDNTISYRIVECGVNTNLYDKVTVNEEEIEGTPIPGVENREDFGIEYKTTKERSRVVYTNEVRESAIRKLSITKHLYDETGQNELHNDNARFSFRLSMGTELSDSLTLTDKFVYHVRTENGEYCKWDNTLHDFVSIGEGKTVFEDLSEEEKKSTSFITSMNGAISKIPAYYTVELRDVLVDTEFEIEERLYEIPDGYSRQKYELYEDEDDTQPTYSSTTDSYIIGKVEEEKDPKVVVSNLKGWGIRMQKEWSDKDYMDERDPVYFAIYKDDGTGVRTLIDGTVRQLGFEDESLYWYFQSLNGDDIHDYYTMEVTVTNPTVNDEGVVTAYDSITPIPDGGSNHVRGIQNGEETETTYTYIVEYDYGDPTMGANVRIDHVTNTRPGLLLKKTDMDGVPLAGATFKLQNDNGFETEFTSDANGIITNAYLGENRDYILTETVSPNGYIGLSNPITLHYSDGVFTAAGGNSDYYSITNVGDEYTLTVKNRPCLFSVVKTDAATNQPLRGVHFELHRQITVGGVTMIDFDPMAGYEDLVSNAQGIVEGLDQTLPAGTYELREKAPLGGYDKISQNILFTIENTGAVVINRSPGDVTLTQQEEQEIIHYLMTVPNSRSANGSLTVEKTVSGNMGNKAKDFHFTVTFGGKYDPERVQAYYAGREGTPTINGSTITFELKHGESIVISKLPAGTTYAVLETEADQDGYQTTYTNRNGTINNNSVIANVHNRRDAAVPTGTTHNAWLWIVICFFGCLAYFILNKKSSSTNFS